MKIFDDLRCSRWNFQIVPGIISLACCSDHETDFLLNLFKTKVRRVFLRDKVTKTDNKNIFFLIIIENESQWNSFDFLI